MQPNPHRPDDPFEWLRRARSNLARACAEGGSDEIYLEDLCFDAQQAAEKSIKALLISKEIDFPYVHDIARLLSVAENAGIVIPERILRAEELTQFATDARYPGLSDPVEPDEHQRAFAIAEEVVNWVQLVLSDATGLEGVGESGSIEEGDSSAG